jgi:hypothetical protein
MPLYQYQRLDAAKREVRFVHIRPGSQDEELSVIIVHALFSIPDPPLYEALSYTWGSEENPQIINVKRVVQSKSLLTKFKWKKDRIEAINGTIGLRVKPKEIIHEL